MKNKLFISFIFISLLSFSQSESDIISIKVKIENAIIESENYKTTILKKTEQTAEGNDITAFTDNTKAIKLIRETYLSETGKTVIWNYIDINQPYFVYKEYYTLKLPITDKKFNALNFNKKEERFYLKNDRIIRWMQDKKIITKYPKNAASIENNMVEHISNLTALFVLQNKE